MLKSGVYPGGITFNASVLRAATETVSFEVMFRRKHSPLLSLNFDAMSDAMIENKAAAARLLHLESREFKVSWAGTPPVF